jgi:hypothetical protein
VAVVVEAAASAPWQAVLARSAVVVVAAVVPARPPQAW